jgi:sulfate transport system substrate-binding protein
VQAKSGRDALQDFISGQGDVLLSYEYEATTAQRKGEELDYVIPGRHDPDRHPVRGDQGRAGPAEAFDRYVISEPAQERFASWGYRPGERGRPRREREKFPTPSKLYAIDRFGGWAKVDEELFDPDKGSIAKIEQDLGISTAK